MPRERDIETREMEKREEMRDETRRDVGNKETKGDRKRAELSFSLSKRDLKTQESGERQEERKPRTTADEVRYKASTGSTVMAHGGRVEEPHRSRRAHAAAAMW
jgi:hypothetical protein